MKEKVSCIIPAFNEGKRISRVINIVKENSSIGEIIVVNDGSKDDTEKVIRKIKGIKIISYRKNKGKTFAVMTGIKKAKYVLILLLDADLEGLNNKNIQDLIDPVIEKKVDVTISLRKNTPFYSKMIGLDYLSGERVFYKSLINCKEFEGLGGYALEATMNKKIISNRLRIGVVPFPNVRTPFKYEKIGSVTKGILGEIAMIMQVHRAAGGIIQSLIQNNRMIRLRKIIKNY